MGCLDVLPIVPEGVNPYPVYAGLIDFYAYNKPTSGFGARLIVLGCLLILGFLESLVLLGLLLLDAHRRNTSEGIWLFRYVRRPEGRQITTNIKLLIPVNSFAVLVVLLGFTFDTYTVYVNHGPQFSIDGWKTGITLPITLGGWVLTFGGLQAYALAPSKSGLHLVRPWILNAIFIGAGGLLLVGQTGAIVVATLRGRHKWFSQIALNAVLVELADAWDGVTVPQTIADVPGLVDLNHQWDVAQSSFSAVYGFTAGFAFIIWMVNLSALALLFTVRRQISLKVRDIRRHLWDETTMDALSRHTKHQPGSPRSGVVEIELQKKATPSRTRFRQLAQEKAAGASSEQARQIIGLKRAASDLLVIAGTAGVLSIGAGTISLTVAIYCRRTNYYLLPWNSLETFYTVSSWTFAVIYPLFNVAFINNTWQNLGPPRSHPQLPTALPRTPTHQVTKISITIDQHTEVDSTTFFSHRSDEKN